MPEFSKLSTGKQSKTILFNVLKLLRHFRDEYFRQKLHWMPKLVLLAEGNGSQCRHIDVGSGLRLWIPVLHMCLVHNIQ